MKKLYLEPEVELVKFSFESILVIKESELSSGEPESGKTDGDDGGDLP